MKTLGLFLIITVITGCSDSESTSHQEAAGPDFSNCEGEQPSAPLQSFIINSIAKEYSEIVAITKNNIHLIFDPKYTDKLSKKGFKRWNKYGAWMLYRHARGSLNQGDLYPLRDGLYSITGSQRNNSFYEFRIGQVLDYEYNREDLIKALEKKFGTEDANKRYRGNMKFGDAHVDLSIEFDDYNDRTSITYEIRDDTDSYNRCIKEAEKKYRKEIKGKTLVL